MIFLDNNSITNGFEEIIVETVEMIKKYQFLNPSSMHTAGKNAKYILEDARQKIANALKAKCHDIYFVSGATEGNNMVLKAQNYGKIFITKAEHSSILEPIKKLPFEFVHLERSGQVNLEDLEEKIKAYGQPNFLCSFCIANNETGVVLEVNKIADIVHKYGGIFHADASQFIGKLPFDFAQYNVDILTFSGNKIHAGFGGGCVIFNSGFEIKPLILGGGQQNYKRGGTENIPSFFALSLAVCKVTSIEYLKEYKTKTVQFQKQIEEMCLKNGGEVFGFNSNRLSNTSMIKMQGINNFIQMMEFDLNDICISIGSACSSGRTEVSYALLASGVKESDAKNFIRVSTSIFNTQQEVEKFCDVWQNLCLKK